jgi:hypothetical protein
MGEPADKSFLLLLPSEAQKRFQQAALANQKLCACCEGQDVILDDLREGALACGAPEEFAKVEAELAGVSKDLEDAEAALLSILLKNSSSPSGNPAEILAVVLNNTIEALLGACLASVSEGMPMITIRQILDIEDQIQRIVQDLDERGMYPERPEDTETRIKIVTEHTKKVMAFIEKLTAKGSE